MARHTGPVKVDKADVEYRQAAQRGNGGRKCGNCIRFCEPHICAIVAGVIVRDHVCNRWEGRDT